MMVAKHFGVEMTTDNIEKKVLEVLAGIVHPISGDDIVASGHVQNLEIREGSDVRFSFVPRPNDPPGLVKEARRVLDELPELGKVEVKVQLPQSGVAGEGAAQAGPPNSSVSGSGPGVVPQVTQKPDILGKGTKVLAVSSGKGGVGKSMVATNLAASLALQGKAVGLLDADIYGPNIPLMFGVKGRPEVAGDKGKEMIQPMEAHGVLLMSLGFLLDEEQPAIMRGPLISGILKQFLEQVEWGDLEFLIVDMPPGTGDAQLSLVQSIDIDGVVMVSTPQAVSTGDVARGIRMFERVNTRVLGIVENMSGLVCPHCSEEIDVFGQGGVDLLGSDMGLPVLGRIPLESSVRIAGDEGTPTVVSNPTSAAAESLQSITNVVLEHLQLTPENS